MLQGKDTTRIILLEKMGTVKENLSNLIKDPELEALELSLKKPDFFSILRVQKQEIRHSNFLAWLLDPKEGHNLTDVFLKWFLKDIFSDIKISWITEFEVDDINLNDIKVLREYHNIDILIVGENFVICIENKIYSSEHSNQLKKYRDFLDKQLKDKNKVFVFLNVYGVVPEDKEDEAVYVIYTYEDIKRNIETILEVYSDGLSPKVKFYIEDYLSVLNRNIMKEDVLIELANKIYQNHKDALDFIYDNKPDRLSDVTKILEKAVERRGLILASKNKGYVRFLTPKLDSIIPRNGKGWKLKESFAFEIVLWGKKVTLKTVVAPGDETTREILTKAISNVNGAIIPKGAQWLVHHSFSKKINVLDEKYEDEELLIKDLYDLLDKREDALQQVEAEILKYRDMLVK